MKTALLKAKAYYSLGFVLPLMAIGTLAQAQGARSAVAFPATTANEHINLGSALSSTLGNSNFTMEMWVNFNAFNSDEPIIANKDWNNGANIGWALTRSSKQSASNANLNGSIPANALWFNMTPVGGTRRDWHITLPNLNLVSNWVHVAIAVDRKGNIAFYFNGVPAKISGYAQNGTNSWAPITTSIAADSNKSMAGSNPVRIGQDGTGTYSARFSGKVDEVRFWNGVLTPSQIQANMCRRLSGSENGLMAYYRLDETTGTTALNSATATAGLYAGTLANNPIRLVSSAPIGDTSVSAYSTPLSGLNLTAAGKGVLSISNPGASLKGLHIYRTDTVNTVAGIPAPGNDSFAFGVFTVDTASAAATYDVSYDFTASANAVAYTSSLNLFSRFSADSAWALTNATKNSTAHTFSLTGLTRRREFKTGNYSTPGVCNVPTGLTVTGITTNSAVLNWTSGGSTKWNLEYGTGNFTPGTGTRLTNLSATTQSLTGLQSNTTYRFYVQDTCVSLLNSSAWAGPVTFTTQKDYSPFGGGYALNFPGTGANEHVNLDTTMSVALATTDFTIETWINFSRFNNDEAFISNKNWNSGFNSGFAWSRSNKQGMPDNSLWFNIMPAGGTRRDWHFTIPGLNLLKNWNHVAAVVDRNGDVSFYINGIKANILQYYSGNSLQGTVSTNIAADSGKSLRGTLPVRVGQDGTGTYSVKFNGQMDELRIWNTVRSQAEIRNFMCRKLPANTGGLLSYLRFDEPSGNTSPNMATGFSGQYNANLINNPVRVPSGAAIGDTSVYLYANTLNGRTLSISSPGAGTLTADSLKPSYAALQLYRVDTLPNTVYDMGNVGSNKTYFGAFPVDTGLNTTSLFALPDASYQLRYDYSNYPAAVAANTLVHLYNRKSGEELRWTDMGAVNNPGANRLTATRLRNRREVMLADFTAQSCANVSNIRIDSQTTTFTILGWTSNGNRWVVRYAPQGQTSFNTDTVTTSPKDTLSNLQADTWYEVYVQNRCGADSSKWTGPFTFKTPDACPAPSQLQSTHLGGDSVRITWNNTGAAVYQLQWGQQGFTLGAGIPVSNVTGTSVVINGLSATMQYDIYIQDTCTGGGVSKWFGPLTFTPRGYTGVAKAAGVENNFRLYPNPAQSVVTIDRTAAMAQGPATVKILNISGLLLMEEKAGSFPHQLNVSHLPAGAYMVQVIAGNERANFRMILSK